MPLIWIRKGLTQLLTHRKQVLALLALLTAIAGYFAAQVRFDSSQEIWFLEHDPDLLTYHRFLDRFEADEVVVIGLITDNIFTPDNLAALERISKAVASAPYVHRVTSLSTVKIPMIVDDFVGINPLWSHQPQTQEAADQIRKQTLENPLLTGGLISEDGKAAAILIQIDPSGTNFDKKVELVEALRATKAAEEHPDRQIRLSGTPVMDETFYRYTERDFALFGPMAVVVVIFCTFIIFRRISASLIPLAVVALALVFTFGVMGALHIKINVITTSLIALVLAVGVASTIHIIADYYQQLMNGCTADEAVKESVLTVVTPCFFTAATTAAGMLSLMVSDLRPVRQFGWLAALAVVIAFLLSFSLVPIILRLVKPPSEAFISRQKNGLMNRTITLLGRPNKRSSITIVVFTFILVIVSAYGISLLEIGLNPINYYRKGDPVLKDALTVDRALGGSITIEGMVTAPNQGLKDPAILERIDRLERWFESLPGITHVLSPVDTLKEINRVFHEGDPGKFTLPDTRALAAQYYLIMEGEEDFDNFIQDDYSVARVTARAELVSAQELALHIPEIEKKIISEYQTEDLQVVITGFVKLLSDMEQYLLNSQIRSFSLAFTVITLMMLLLLRSIGLTFFSMIPNLAPIAMGLAFMGITAISLDPGTVMIGSIAMGLVVDDTVHFMVRLRRRLKAGEAMQSAIAWTMHSTGRPIMVTSFVLAAGCLVLTLGSFAPNIYFGAISSLIIVLALICDLVVLPAALILVRPKV